MDHMSGTQTLPVSLTEGALAEFKRLMESKGLDAKHGVRIGVKGGGCAGFSYVLGFDEVKEGDEVYEYEGLRLLVKTMHKLYLEGTTIDYHTGLDARGFVFSNPNASETCGCGSSFSA